MKKIALTFAVAACGCMISAGELFAPKSPAEFNLPKRITQNGEVFSIKGNYNQLRSKATYDIDPAKKYTISGDVRLAAGKAPYFYLALIPKTADGKEIKSSSVNAAKGTETELAAEAKTGDKVLKIKDGSKWNAKHSYPHVAFDVKDALADLPNPNVSDMEKGGVKKTESGWEVTLKKPLTKAYPAGTKVRQHFSGGTFIYPVKHAPATPEWEKRIGKISGMSQFGCGGSKFWQGTKKVTVVIFTVGAGADTVVEFKNIKFEVAD